MIQTKAASVAAALITAGYMAEAIETPDGAWQVYARSFDGSPVAVSTINTFATNNGVTAWTDRAKFV